MCSYEMSAFEQDLQEIGMSTSSITPKSLNAHNYFNLLRNIGMLHLKFSYQLEESN